MEISNIRNYFQHKPKASWVFLKFSKTSDFTSVMWVRYLNRTGWMSMSDKKCLEWNFRGERGIVRTNLSQEHYWLKVKINPFTISHECNTNMQYKIYITQSKFFIYQCFFMMSWESFALRYVSLKPLKILQILVIKA